jgi:lycopene beta-cyclase
LTKEYDYIITGAGCAGLSLLIRVLQEPSLSNKKILVIDEQPKNKNDRTWCFWEKENGLFEDIVHHCWQELKFESTVYTGSFSIAPYSYKMIHGLDFYNHVINFASKFSNVEFRYENVIKVATENSKAIVQLANEKIYANYIFNSILFEQPTIAKNEYYLLQHFKGWVIETNEPCFDINKATFMDFTVSQQHGTTFMYVLPTAKNKALVEYTLFTEKLLPQEAYATALQEYITEKLGIQSYNVLHEEFGIIPMTNHLFPTQQGNVVYMGIAGGQAKGSSGYAFNFIQKRTAQIVKSLLHNNHPFVTRSFSDKKFHLYDSVLLNVLQNKKMEGAAIFSSIFKGNKPQNVLQFLDNDSNLLQDLKIMSSVPTSVFLPAAVVEIIK